MRNGRLRIALVALLLIAAQFVLRPHLGDARFTPDFVLVALVLFAVRSRPGAGAAAGFLVGLATDALAPTAFGAAALAHTLVGYFTGWLKAFVVADSAPIMALFVLGAAWARDVIQVLAAHQLVGNAMLWQLFVYSPAAALASGAVSLFMVAVLGSWLSARSPA